MHRSTLVAALALALPLLAACERRSNPPPAAPDTNCVADADCSAWPSGCCAWMGLNRSDGRPPGPGAGCEMVCPREPTRVGCVGGRCQVELGPNPQLRHPKKLP